MKNYTLTLLAAATCATSAFADSVVTKDGSTLNGTIIGIEENTLTIETDYAGTVTLPVDQVDSFSSDNQLKVALDNGSTFVGKVTSSEGGGLTVATNEGPVLTYMAEVEESWQPGSPSPAEKRNAAALAKLERHWTYEASLDFSGKSGNTKSSTFGADFRAILADHKDSLEFYLGGNYQKTESDSDENSEPTADDIRGGVKYTSNIGDSLNWYVRSEFGKDAVKQIDLSMSTAAGLGYVFTKTETRELNINSGIGYRYETYQEATAPSITREDLSAASFDFGAYHKEVFNWGTLVNRLNITPLLEDFGNYRAIFDTSVTLPLQKDGWSVRVGANFDYDSEADKVETSNGAYLKNLDTTYYARLVLSWK